MDNMRFLSQLILNNIANQLDFLLLLLMPHKHMRHQKFGSQKSGNSILTNKASLLPIKREGK